MIHWIERHQHPIIVVAHQAVLRCIYAYFFKSDKQEIPNIPISLHTVIKLIPETYFFNEVNYEIDPNTNQVTRRIEKPRKKSVDLPGQERETPRIKKIQTQPTGFNFPRS